jgi:hypothetical protein
MTDSVGFGIVAHCDSGLEKNALKKVFLLSFQTELLFPVISNAMQWSEKSFGSKTISFLRFAPK